MISENSNLKGTAELLQLAQMFRVGASTARDIASIRKVDATEINSLADQVEAAAEDLERIGRTPAAAPVPQLSGTSRH